MIVVVRTEVTTIVITAQKARFTEILVIEYCGAIRVTSWRLIVVAYRNAIRHTLCHAGCSGVLDEIKGYVSVLPFDLKLIAMLGAVAELGHKDNVSRGDVIHYPIHLRVHDRRAAAIPTGSVVLCVGYGDDCKVRSWSGESRDGASEEGNVQIRAIRIRDGRFQSSGSGNICCTIRG